MRWDEVRGANPSCCWYVSQDKVGVDGMVCGSLEEGTRVLSFVYISLGTGHAA